MHSLKHAVRALAKSPALVLVAVVTLALGVGATTAIFSVVDAVVLRPLPFPDGERLAFLGNKRPSSKNIGNAWSWPNFKDVKDQSRMVPELAAFYGGSFTLTGRGDARRIDGTVSTADLFRVLRAPPVLGRDFAAGEDVPGKNNVVILGHAFWTSEFHADRSVIGQTVTQASWPVMGFVVRSASPVAAALRAAARSVDPDVPAEVKPLQAYMRESVAQRRLTAQLLLLFAGVALLMALVGVYGVVSYGVTQRVHELSVRAALGARPAQLVGLILRHGLVLAGIGVVTGVGLSIAITRLLSDLLFGVTAADPITFTVVAAALVGVTAVASFVPARRAARLDPMTVLRKE